MNPDDALSPLPAGTGPWVRHHGCTHPIPPHGNSFLSSTDLLNLYSLSLPGSLKMSPVLMGEGLAWDGGGKDTATTGLEELMATLPWGRDQIHHWGEIPSSAPAFALEMPPPAPVFPNWFLVAV